MPNMLNAAQTAEFNQKGFTYARGLFAPDEVKLLTDAMEQDPAVRSSILDRRDAGSDHATRNVVQFCVDGFKLHSVHP